MGRRPTVSRDDDQSLLERAAQQAAERHLEACRVAYWHEELCEGGECTDEIPESPAAAPFDDCDTCVVREVLWAAWPYLKRLAELTA